MTDTPNEKDQYLEKEVLQEERYLWMARAFSLIALLAFVANIFVLIALSGLRPLLRVQPYFLQFQNKDYQVISIVRPDFSSMSKEDLELLEKSLVREYLLARYGIGSDVDAVAKHWDTDGVVYAMSEASVYQDFLNTEVKLLGEKETYIERIKKDGLTREPRILSVTYLGNVEGKNRWGVEMDMVQMSSKFKTEDVSRWQVTMEVVFQPSHKRMTWAQRLRNPLGFTVTKFRRKSLEERGNSI